MSKVVVRVWAILLIALGLGVAAYKVYFLGLPLKPGQNAEVWTVQARLVFDGQGTPAQVGFHIPSVIPGFVMLDEDFISSRYGFSIENRQDNRHADWSVRRAKGRQTLYYRIVVARSGQLQSWDTVPAYPKTPQYQEPYGSAIKAILDDVRKESADVNSYTRELLQRLNAKQPNENVKLLRGKAGDGVAWVHEIINVLKGVRIPSRVLWGIRVSDSANNAVLEPLLQVHNGQKWLTFHPETGVSGIPDNFLAWKVGDDPLFAIEGGKHPQLDFSVTKTYEELIDVARQGAAQMDSVFTDFSLMALPVQNQNVYRLLLMLPIGALLVVFMRTFVGLKTFGTFMPILIAMAFRETQLLWGIFLFSVIVFLGLMIRFYLERMMLLLVPRLSAILVVVVILMLFISLVSAKLGSERALSVSLFPMVIMAMTIERMSITWEENGGQEAMMQGLGSLLVACAGYLLMTNSLLMYIMFVFPELLFVVLALSLWMGRYTGYRLSELRRFRTMISGGK